MVYGEIEFKTFAEMLDDLPYNKEQRVFYDLGSGVGKPVIAAALLCDFTKVCGVELLEDLHNEALRIKDLFDNEVRNLFPSKKKLQMEFICDDLFKVDFSDGDVVFIQSTCFSEDNMKQLENKCEILKPESLIITATKSLPSWPVVGMKRYKMSWGEVSLFFHLKQNNNFR